MGQVEGPDRLTLTCSLGVDPKLTRKQPQIALHCSPALVSWIDLHKPHDTEPTPRGAVALNIACTATYYGMKMEIDVKIDKLAGMLTARKYDATTHVHASFGRPV